jgi:4-hydroxybenzoyl-CoA thioesterase
VEVIDRDPRMEVRIELMTHRRGAQAGPGLLLAERRTGSDGTSTQGHAEAWGASGAWQARIVYNQRMPPFLFATPVRFADVDHAGIVYYPRFFHFFHLAFEELWRQRIGARAYLDIIDRRRIGFPAVRAEADYQAPLRFGDTAEIEVTVARLGGKSITFRYRVFRAGEPEAAPPVARVLAAEGQVVCAVTDLERFVAVAIPDDVKGLLADLVEPAA